MFRTRECFFCDGEIFTVEHLSESGVKWLLIRSLATDRIDGAVAYLERNVRMAGKNGKPVRPASIAEQLLARKKETAGNCTEAYDEDFIATTPNVHELLTRKLTDDKKVYEPGSLLIFARSGSWHACLTHKGLNLKWWGEGGCIKHALAALEASTLKEMGQEAVEGSRANTGQP